MRLKRTWAQPQIRFQFTFVNEQENFPLRHEHLLRNYPISIVVKTLK